MTKHQVIGIYGVSGSGKSTLLARLKQDIVMTSASFYEGSSILASLTGTIKEFQSLSRKEQDDLRTTAIQSIDKSLPSIVTGHYSFPTRDLNRFEPIMTEADKKEFTHVIYLNTAASQVFHRSINKHGLSIYQIQKWIDFEIIQLEAISSKAGIKFISVGPIIDYDVILKTVQEILGISSFSDHAALQYLDSIVGPSFFKNSTFWLIDGDNTLSTSDTAKHFWNEDQFKNLKSLFNNKYTGNPFQQAALLYDDLDSEEYLKMTENAVLKSEIRTEWIEILKNLPESISVIVVTSGIRSVWKSLVKQVGLDIPVFAANKSSHGFAVDGAAKKDLVTRIRNRSPNSTIFAFGDSAVDIPMMIESDYGIIVSSLRNSGQEETDLRMVGQNFSQILLPADSTPRNNVAVTTLDAILKYSTSDSQCFTHFTKETSSKILSTRLRNSCNNGPTLRSLHNIVGQHLALKLADRLKTEEICFNHVQGTVSSGFRMNDEKQTLIVPLMRGGEPMAFGVSEIFQEASFIHAKIPTDIQDKDLIYCKRVVLVDSVINNGKSIREFIHDFIDRNLGSFEVWILVAVTQKHASRSLAREFGFYSGNCVKKVSFFSLRISENKYTGVGGTDTGHRLFNTIHRD